MKQKYSLTHDDQQAKLIIREYGEHEKGEYVLLCEAAYDDEAVRAAIDAGGATLVSLLRSPDFYPPAEHADRITEGVVALYTDDGPPVHEILFDDIEALARHREAAVAAEQLVSTASDDIGMLLDDEQEEEEEDDEKDPTTPPIAADDVAPPAAQENVGAAAEE